MYLLYLKYIYKIYLRINAFYPALSVSDNVYFFIQTQLYYNIFAENAVVCVMG